MDDVPDGIFNMHSYSSGITALYLITVVHTYRKFAMLR